MTWELFERFWWLLGSVVLALLGYVWKLAITVHKSKERLAQVAEHDISIKALQTEMTTIKDDISEIKVGVDKQGQDTAAILSSLQSIMNALYDRDCNIGPARKEFSDYLARR